MTYIIYICNDYIVKRNFNVHIAYFLNWSKHIINSYKKVNRNIAFDEKISLGHNNKMGAKYDGKVKTYKILI